MIIKFTIEIAKDEPHEKLYKYAIINKDKGWIEGEVSQ
jgi:hypothetical protein